MPAEIAGLRAPGSPASAQMLYRFRSAATAAALRADARRGARGPASGALSEKSPTWRSRRKRPAIAPFVPFLIAFGLIGIVMSVLIVANVVSGAVVAGLPADRRPEEHRLHAGPGRGRLRGQVTVPAAVGCVAGVALGNPLAVPLLAKTARVYGVGTSRSRSGSTSRSRSDLRPRRHRGAGSGIARRAAERCPSDRDGPRASLGRGYRAHRLLGRLPLPRAVSIGLAAPFARPGRTALTLAALSSAPPPSPSPLACLLAETGHRGLSHEQAQSVSLSSRATSVPAAPGHSGPARAPSPASRQHAIEAALANNPARCITWPRCAQATRARPAEQVPVTAFRGNATWTGYDLISGHWYSGPDQVDVPTGFLTPPASRSATPSRSLDGQQIRADRRRGL